MSVSHQAKGIDLGGSMRPERKVAGRLSGAPVGRRNVVTDHRDFTGRSFSLPGSESRFGLENGLAR
jgi:hypothetical protein